MTHMTTAYVEFSAHGRHEMGFFIQISNDSGRPLFQVSKNYPEVSFASSALFHALVTASLEPYLIFD